MSNQEIRKAVAQDDVMGDQAVLDVLVRDIREGHGSRHKYFASTRLGLGPEFCAVLQSKILPGDQSLWPAAFDPNRGANQSGPYRDLPWLTPVLGSGALGISKEFEAKAHRLPEAVEKAAREWCGKDAPPELDDANPPAEQARLFTQALIWDRLAPESEELTTSAPGVGELALIIVLAASQLTSLFHRLSEDESRLISRWDTGEVKITTHGWQKYLVKLGPRLGWLKDTLITDAIDLLGNEIRPAEPHGPAHAVSLFLEKLRSSLDPAVGGLTISARQVKIMSDIAWHYLVINDASYPGWSDLLIELVLQSQQAVTARRPAWEVLRDLDRAVSSVLEPIATKSWTIDGPQPAGGFQDLHDAVAEVLVSQWAAGVLLQRRKVERADFANRIEAEEVLSDVKLEELAAVEDELNLLPDDLPRPISFVTTFDIELEAALWRVLKEWATKTAYSGRFGEPPTVSIVVPAYYSEPPHREGAFVWLEATLEVDPDLGREEALARVRKPAPSDWHVMSSARAAQNQSNPTVVHLAGAPLIELPGLGDAESGELLEELRRIGVASGVGHGHLQHSVTLDEYLALRQAEAEHYWAVASGVTKDKGAAARVRSRHLPGELLRSDNGPVRYWLALGVPMMDPAVRLRVVGHITRLRFLSEGGTSRRRKVFGAAVNLRMDSDDQLLLSTLGFDVVRERCEAFTDDLRHYARHMRGSADALPDVNGCHLPKGSY